VEERRRTYFDDHALIVDGRAVRWWAATVYYAHTPRASWKRALTELRRIGITIVEAPVPWGAHEPRSGAHDFAGPLDLGGFLDEAAAAGLHVALELSPMTDGEQRFGGLPERIVRDEELWARTAHGGPAWVPQPTQAWPLPSWSSTKFQAEIARWYAAVAAVIVPRAAAGGPVVAIGLGLGLAALTRSGAFDLDYHPDAIAAWHATHREDPPRTSTSPQAATWVRWKGAQAERALAALDTALDAVGLDGLARYGTAPPIDPHLDEVATTWPRAADLASGTTSPRVARRRAVHRHARVAAGHSTWFAPTTEPERRALELTALATGARGLTWSMGVARDRWIGGLVTAEGAPTAEAHRAASLITAADKLPRLRRRADVGLVVSRADSRHGVASSLVDPVPPAALELLGLGPAGGAALAEDAGAGLAHRWFDAVARALDLAQVAWALVDERRELITLEARAFVVPTLARVDRALWRQLHQLAGDRRVIVYGPDAPTLDELGGPLADDLAPPRRAGTMRPGSLDDVRGLAADLAALAPRDEWTAGRCLVDLFEDDAGKVRALFVTNPTGKPVRATLTVGAGASLRDALDDQPVRADALDLPAHSVRWLAVSW